MYGKDFMQENVDLRRKIYWAGSVFTLLCGVWGEKTGSMPAVARGGRK